MLSSIFHTDTNTILIMMFEVNPEDPKWLGNICSWNVRSINNKNSFRCINSFLWNDFFLWNSQGDYALNSYINWWILLISTCKNTSMKNISTKVNHFYSETFLPWKIFKDALMMWTSCICLIMAIAYLISVFSQDFPANTNNLSRFAYMTRSSRPSTFYKIGCS